MLVTHQVERHLPPILKHLGLVKEGFKDVQSAEPNAISADAAVSNSGYSEVWNIENFKVSFARNDVYSAAGCLTWVSPCLVKEDSSIELDAFSFELLQGLTSIFTPGANGRIMLNLLLVGVLKEDAISNCVSGSTYPRQIHPVFGHPVIWAWYMLIAEALFAKDTEKITMLWDVACCCPLRVVRDPVSYVWSRLCVLDVWVVVGN